jgi:pyrimidine-nucleoside phosphorylase
MNALPLIEAKRDGKALSPGQIRDLIAAYTSGEVPDYQMAALLMAIYFRGLDSSETRALTYSMRDSGPVLKFPEDSQRPVVDKHSTGGVGDKVSLPLAPLLASLGFRVPMISGRALGITGGTLDKLESIPGFRTQLNAAEIVQQVEDIGCVICGQTTSMCPADRLMYALRDATGTVPSIPLITASILSKKLAEGIQVLVLDVKFGSGAFMPSRERAQELADLMIQIGLECGVKTRALLTDMNTPLGRAAGNWLEVREAVACLEGQGPDDLRELVLRCAARFLEETGRCADEALGRAQAARLLESGEALHKWNQMLAAQGTDLPAYQRALATDQAVPVLEVLRAEQPGAVTRCDARVIGEVVRDLGGGRFNREAAIDPRVGVDELKKPGDTVQSGETLCRIHAPDIAKASKALLKLREAFDLRR